MSRVASQFPKRACGVSAPGSRAPRVRLPMTRSARPARIGATRVSASEGSSLRSPSRKRTMSGGSLSSASSPRRAGGAVAPLRLGNDERAVCARHGCRPVGRAVVRDHGPSDERAWKLVEHAADGGSLVERRDDAVHDHAGAHFRLSAARAAASRASGSGEGTAGDVVEAHVLEELDEGGVPAVLAANPDLEASAWRARPENAGLAGGAWPTPFTSIEMLWKGSPGRSCDPRSPEGSGRSRRGSSLGHLGEIVRAKREEVGMRGDLVGEHRAARGTSIMVPIV